MAQFKQPAKMKYGVVVPDENGVARFENVDAIKVPSGATLERPPGAEPSMFRFNSEDDHYEGSKNDGTFDRFILKSDLDEVIGRVLDEAPEALDTLRELAEALGNDPNFAATIATSLALRLRFDIDDQGLTTEQKLNAMTNLGLLSTDDLPEGVNNLYFTEANVRESIDVAGIGLSYDPLTGVITSLATAANTNSSIVARDATGNFAANIITAALVGNASSASKWATSRTYSFTGDATGSYATDGSANGTTALTLANVNSNIGSFNKLTVNAKGLVTAASNMVAQDITDTLGYIPYRFDGVKQSAGLNTFLTQGIYALNSGLTDEPPGSGWGNVMVLRSGGDTTQIYTNFEGNMWLRGGAMDAISGAWNKVWHSGNLDPSGFISAESPNFTGIPRAPTASAGSNTTQLATTAFVTGAISDLKGAAPTVLDTLKKLADAIGGDANFSTTISTALGLKAPINNPTFTGTVGGITKAMVGLSLADNTSDASKPVSTAQQTALNAKLDIAANTTSNLTDFANDSATTTGLTYGYKAGVIRNDNVTTSVVAGTIALTASTVNYIQMSGAGVVSVNTIGFTTGQWPMSAVTTDATSITAQLDKRAFASIGGGGGGGAESAFLLNLNVVNDNFTIPSGKNAVSAGPIEIATGKVVDVSPGSVWTVV